MTTTYQRRTGRIAVRRRAVSLAEVCVVIAAVATALALASQSARAVRASSKQSVCAHRLGQVVESAIVYAAIDSGENIIPAHALGLTNSRHYDNPWYIDGHAYGGKSGAGRSNFCALNAGKYGTRCGVGPATRPLNKIIYGDIFPDYKEGTDEQRLSDTRLVLEPYICPADSGYGGAHCSDWSYTALTSYDFFGTSFVANVFVYGSSNGQGTIKSAGPYLRPVSTVPDPARTIAYWENVGGFAWAVREDPCDFLPGVDPHTPNDTVGGWHGKDWTYNSAFVDGHVDSIYMHSFSPHPETSYPLNPGGGGGTYNYYRCVMVRGDNWQLDVLPAEPVDTVSLSPGGRPSYAACVGP